MTGYLALFGWPAAVATFFSRYGLAAAVSVTVIYGYLFLPIRPVVNLPILPPIDKTSIPALAALFFVLSALQSSASPNRLGLIPQGKLLRILLIGFLLCGVGAAYLNSDTLRYGSTVIPGMSLYDGLSSIGIALVTLLPFVIGYCCLATPKDQRVLLSVLAVAGVVYSVLCLYEMRMAPQLNMKIYGFFPHDWIQHRRGSGWRPIVFLEHGLWVAVFLSMAAIAGLGLFRLQAGEQTRKGLWLALITGATLFLTGQLTGTLILLACGSLVLFAPLRLQFIFAAAISAIVLLYPLARGANLIPVDAVLSVAESISEDRADSLEFRVNHEEILLEKARQRPMFGWGGWGRGLIYDQAGRLTSITDGYWIIVFGNGGLARYLTEMGLLCLPIILLARRQRSFQLGPETAVVVLVLAGNLIDLMPNAGISPITWLLAGALWGRLALERISSDDDPADTDVDEPLSAYTRQRVPIQRAARSTASQPASQYRRSHGIEPS